MTTLSITALAADHNFASMIEGFGVEPGESAQLTVDDVTTSVRVGYDDIEIRFQDAATVTITRPIQHWNGEWVRPATVTHSSSDSNDEGITAAARTAQVLAFAVRVAQQLNAWAEAGELPRLND